MQVNTFKTIVLFREYEKAVVEGGNTMVVCVAGNFVSSSMVITLVYLLPGVYYIAHLLSVFCVVLHKESVFLKY